MQQEETMPFQAPPEVEKVVTAFKLKKKEQLLKLIKGASGPQKVIYFTLHIGR